MFLVYMSIGDIVRNNHQSVKINHKGLYDRKVKVLVF